MKKLIILTLAAAALLTAATPAAAGGQTVCVFRVRPVAIQSVPYVVTYAPHAPYSSPQMYSQYRMPCQVPCGYVPRFPVTYGTFVPRTHFVSPCMPNGYVGGLRNIPSNVIQIPHTFGKTCSQ